MAMNKVKQGSQMYPWVTHTWNVIKGKCPHDCSYCYMKRFPQRELHFDEKELKTALGSGNFIFVGSSCDMWASVVPTMWINDVIEHCSEYDNRYLFQTKNPQRFFDAPLFNDQFPLLNILLGTTIETNREVVSKAPDCYSRAYAMAHLSKPAMISMEPIMDFDLDIMVRWIGEIKPEFVSIGADSGYNNLPEPSGDKVVALIKSLREFTEVKVKDNLGRLLVRENTGRN